MNETGESPTDKKQEQAVTSRRADSDRLFMTTMGCLAFAVVADHLFWDGLPRRVEQIAFDGVFFVFGVVLILGGRVEAFRHWRMTIYVAIFAISVVGFTMFLVWDLNMGDGLFSALIRWFRNPHD